MVDPAGMLLTINGFMIFAGLWGLTINWLTKRIVNKRFKEEFEIGVVDEWEKLAASSSKGLPYQLRRRSAA